MWLSYCTNLLIWWFQYLWLILSKVDYPTDAGLMLLKVFIDNFYFYQIFFNLTFFGKNLFFWAKHFIWRNFIWHGFARFSTCYATGYKLYWERERERIWKWHLGIIIWRYLRNYVHMVNPTDLVLLIIELKYVYLNSMNLILSGIIILMVWIVYLMFWFWSFKSMKLGIYVYFNSI